MKSKRDIYCDYEFWNSFFELESVIIKDRKKRCRWDSFCGFLTSNNLYFNISRCQILEDTDGGNALFDLCQQRGGAGIKFIPQEFPQIQELNDNDDDRLNSVFLTTKKEEECKFLSSQFGVLVFNLEMVFSSEHVFKDNGQAFTKENGKNWNYLFEFKGKCPSISCCNSLVIVDRYILADTNENVLNANLKPIFSALLPDALANHIVFTICIVAQKMGNNINGKLDRIKKLVRQIRPNLVFCINIFGTRHLHDRTILTNNIMLSSGAGFDVIGTNEEPLKFTTTSLVFPFFRLDKKESENYLEWINNVLREEQKCRSYQENYWGEESIKHHLLDYYYEEPIIPKASYSIGDTLSAKLLSALQFPSAATPNNSL